jgi:hypothetical protein
VPDALAEGEEAMSEHQLYLNLSDNGWVTARCGCDDWHRERQVKLGQRVSEVVCALEEEFEQHAGIEASPPHAQALPPD